MASLLALLSSGMWGTADYLAGRLSRRMAVLVVLGTTQAVGLVVMLIVATVSGSWRAPTGYLGWSVLASVAGSAGLALYYRALAMGTMGVVSPIASLGVAVPLIAGLKGGDDPTRWQSIGIVVALAGVVLASGPEVNGEAGWRPVALAGGAAVLLGLATLAIARGSAVSVVMTMTAMRIVTVSGFALTLVVLRSRVTHRVTRSDLPGLVAIGVLDVGANLAFGAATVRGLLSLVSVFGSLYPVATILLARWLDDEQLWPVQQVGVGLALAGAAAISAG